MMSGEERLARLNGERGLEAQYALLRHVVVVMVRRALSLRMVVRGSGVVVSGNVVGLGRSN